MPAKRSGCYPPCRWFRRQFSERHRRFRRYPPCRWFRSNVYRSSLPAIRYPPCRRFKNVSSRPFFEKFRHLAAGTLAFDPVHDLGKLSAVEDEGKAPIPGVDTLPTLWVGSLCIHECPLLDVLPSALLPQYRGRFVFGRGGGIDCLRLCYAARRLVKGGLGGGRLHEPLIALGAGIFERLCDAGEELPVRVPVVVLDAGSVLPSASKVLDFKKFILFLTVTDRLRI